MALRSTIRPPAIFALLGWKESMVNTACVYVPDFGKIANLPALQSWALE